MSPGQDTTSPAGAEPPGLSAVPVPGLPEIEAGFNLGAAIAGAMDLKAGDILAISQKAVSKAEGRVVGLAGVEPGPDAARLATELNRDPRLVELILGESRSVIRTDPERGILITETVHGHICANSGIDGSNLAEPDSVALLPVDPDGSARRIRREVESAAGFRPAVVISDSFGRAWRLGQVEVAIGLAGIEALDDWRGRRDRAGRLLEATVIGVADQIAAAADLARHKQSGTPAVRVRGLERYVRDENGPGCQSQIRPPDEDLFR